MSNNGGSGKKQPGRIVQVLGTAAIRHPWWTILGALILVAVAGSGVTKLEFSNNYRVFFSEENPELVAFEEFQDTYTKNDNIMFVLQPPGGQVFSQPYIQAVERLTNEAWKIPYASRVDSVTNFQHSWADGDELTVEDLVRDSESLTAEDLARKKEIALAEPLLRHNLISPDGGTTGVNVTLQYPEESLEEVPNAVNAARNMADLIERDYPGMKVAISGVSALNNAFSEAGQRDAGTLLPAMFAVLVLFMVIVLRSTTGTTATFAVIALSAFGALGLAGHFGILLTPISVTAPVIILTLAIADSIHILVSLQNFMRRGMEKRAALMESLRVNVAPVIITSVTTVVGFLSMNFSDAPPFKDLGNITAMGIGMALFLSLTLLPALIRLMPLKVRLEAAGTGRTEKLLARINGFVTLRYRWILAGMGTAIIALTALVPMLDLNDSFVEYFDHRVEFRNDAEFAIDNLNGIYLIEFSLPSGEAGGISEPAYLARLDEFTGWLRKQELVTHVYSYADVIKRLNKNMHGDDPAAYALPEDRELAAQYLLLYELSLPYGLDLNDRINIDKSATRVTASMGNVSTGQIREFLGDSERWLAANAPGVMQVKPTGASVMFAYISQRNIEDMLTGNAVAVVLITIIMMIALRSFGMGALSLIPNMVPILMAFGLWAIFVRQMGMAAATVSATSLGIVVDDTVHFLAKYVRARREDGLDAVGAVKKSFETVGPAILGTTFILMVGFGVLAASTFLINSQMGLLTAMTIVLALFADLLLLPAILIWAGRTQEQEEKIHENVIAEAV